jgi:EAL domain-containing protein (putative c-di-GMP-specific phosphodiesterase class I)
MSLDKVLPMSASSGNGGTFDSQMSEALAQQTDSAANAGREARNSATQLCFVVDEEPSVCHFLSLVLQGSGLDTQEFQDWEAFREATLRDAPELVFLNIPLESGGAIASLVALGKAGFSGAIQLMSNRGSAVLEHVKNIGDQNKLNMLPVLKKPFETNTIIRIVQELKLGDLPPMAARIDLGDAIDNGWVEFWYQPKIDLRRKQLVGVEAFARVRHPEHGVLSPGAFIPGADSASLVALSEMALKAGLTAGQQFAKLGIHPRMAVNMPAEALQKVPIAEIVQRFHAAGEKWPGLIIDVPEEQIVTDLALAHAVTKQLQPYNVKLAIDDFGRGYSSLARLKELPFAELKLDRTFVTDCGSDKVNAPLCKTVIDLAHNFGSIAVAIGIEKASDVVALISMGCDYGQGFLLGQPMPEGRFLSLLKQRSHNRPSGTGPASTGGSGPSATPQDRAQAAAVRKADLHPLDQL